MFLELKLEDMVFNTRRAISSLQTRMSIVKDFARILFEVERARYPELSTANKDTVAYEELLFVANLTYTKTDLDE